MKKVHLIRQQLDVHTRVLNCEPQLRRTFLSQFDPVSELIVRNIIMKLPNKSCFLVPIPTTLLKQCVSELLPYMIFLINLSLNTGEICIYLKTAVVSPVLKYAYLEPVLNNYRPISNLPTLSKIMEKVVSEQLSSYVYSNKIADLVNLLIVLIILLRLPSVASSMMPCLRRIKIMLQL